MYLTGQLSKSKRSGKSLKIIEKKKNLHHASLAYGKDGNHEFFSFGYHHEVVVVVNLSLGGKSDDKRDLHSWSYFVALRVAIEVLFSTIQDLYKTIYLEKAGIRLDYLNPPDKFIFIPQFEDLVLDL